MKSKTCTVSFSQRLSSMKFQASFHLAERCAQCASKVSCKHNRSAKPGASDRNEVQSE